MDNLITGTRTTQSPKRVQSTPHGQPHRRQTDDLNTDTSTVNAAWITSSLAHGRHQHRQCRTVIDLIANTGTFNLITITATFNLVALFYISIVNAARSALSPTPAQSTPQEKVAGAKKILNTQHPQYGSSKYAPDPTNYLET